MSVPLLELLQASKTFAGVVALRDAHLSLAEGEVRALMGENGAGKSTLIKLLAGVLSADTMELQVDGVPALLRSPADARRLGFRFIHQELNRVATLSVAENIFLGHPYTKTPFGTVNWRQLAERARETLASLGVTHVDVRQAAGRLSPGDAMLVTVARAFADGASARLFVMDEPTAALSRTETNLLFEVIRGLRARGVSVLYVSHRVEEVFEIADRITVMRDGCVVGTAEVHAVTAEGIISQMTGRQSAEAYPTPNLMPRGAPVLHIKGASNARLTDISLTLREGEIVGVAGLAGSGRSAMLRALAGDRPFLMGSVKLAGETVNLSSPAKAWRKGVAFVPEERRSQGLVMRASVRANTALPHLKSLSRWGFADRGRELTLARRLAQGIGLKAQSLEQPVHRLSGGNQQKVVLARALAARPKVLLLDEPTRGVDVGAKRDIYDLVLKAAGEGAAVLVASSELPELLGLCSRILVLQRGRQVHEVPARDLSQARLLALCYPEATA